MAVVYGVLRDAQGNELRDKVLAQGVADNKAAIEAIQQVVAGQSTTIVVDDIAGRDAIESPTVGTQCWVKDASADPTVTSGAAKYIYESAEAGWVKTAEAESMDVVLSWDNVTDKEIDAAVVEHGVTPSALAAEGFFFEKAAAVTD